MDIEILQYILIGFAAQMVDGALGMAYGVISTTFLLSAGIAPAAASASVHAAEVFTTGVSGLAHHYHRNVDPRLFARLVVPGVVGGVVGAYVLTEVPGAAIKPFIALYLMGMGVVILYKAVRARRSEAREHRVTILGLAGGFFDAVGGGGWGPIVASTLIARGVAPRFTVGSVNMAEFFVTLAISAAFIASLGLGYVRIILGLLIGGVVAAPVAAYLVKRLPARAIMILVGLVIVAVSGHNAWQALR